MESNPTNKYYQLECSFNDYQHQLIEMEISLKKYVKFEFAIFHLPNKGFVLQNKNTSCNALLCACIAMIQVAGSLTEENFQNI